MRWGLRAFCDDSFVSRHECLSGRFQLPYLGWFQIRQPAQKTAEREALLMTTRSHKLKARVALGATGFGAAGDALASVGSQASNAGGSGSGTGTGSGAGSGTGEQRRRGHGVSAGSSGQGAYGGGSSANGVTGSALGSGSGSSSSSGSSDSASGTCPLCPKNCPLSAPQCSRPYEAGLI